MKMSALSDVVTLLIKFGDAALFSDTQISLAASQLAEIEFELSYLRNKNDELQKDIDSGFIAGSYARLKELQEIERQFNLKKSYEVDYSLICRLQKHVYIDGVCAECGRADG